jgi:hypothetical protein
MNSYSINIDQHDKQRQVGSQSVQIAAEVDQVPHWQIFPGNYSFFCNGRLHTSKNWFVVPCVLALIVVPSGFHLGFEYVFFS